MTTKKVEKIEKINSGIGLIDFSKIFSNTDILGVVNTTLVGEIKIIESKLNEIIDILNQRK